MLTKLRVMNKLFHHHHCGEPDFYWHLTNMFLEDVKVWGQQIKLKCTVSFRAHTCALLCVRACVCVRRWVSQISKQIQPTTAQGHSSHNCAGGILEILTQQGSISLQVTENDIIKPLLTLQTIRALLRPYWQWILSNQTVGSGLCPQSKTITSQWITEKCPSGQEWSSARKAGLKMTTAISPSL